MSVIRMLGFQGRIPRLKPRLLPNAHAQAALNTRLEDGAIGPLRASVDAFTLGASANYFLRHGGLWKGWAGDVDAVPGPVAEDRLYITGNGSPKMEVGGTTYDLGLPAPAAGPTMTVVGTLDPTEREDIFYVYTFVTSLGEESAPSPARAPVPWSTGLVVQLAGFSTPPSGRGVTQMRIYRSQTAASGITSLFFVDEVPATTTTYDHDLALDPMQEELGTAHFSVPPSGLRGLISMPNGMMAAFVGKELHFCEPYQPHAWPSGYSRTVDYPIVGLASFGSTLAVLTTGTPYIGQGTHPENVVIEKVEQTLPCLSRRGIVDLGYSAAYPSTDGLVLVSPSGAQLVTRSLFTQEQWRRLNPDSFVAGQHNGRYVFSHLAPEDANIDQSGTDAEFVTRLFDYYLDREPGDAGLAYYVGLLTGGATRSEVEDLFAGGRLLGVIDLKGEQPFYISGEDKAAAMWYDISAGDLYFINGNAAGTVIRQWDSGVHLSQLWRSKLHHLPTPVNFGAILIEGDEVAASTGFTARVYADGLKIATLTTYNQVDRLPSGFLADRWEVEVEGTLSVTSISLAGSPTELSA